MTDQNGNSLNKIVLSICILHYNRFEELLTTISKIGESGFKEYEIIIVDNASASFDKNILEKTDARIRIIELKKNVGISGWNYAFSAACGEIFLVLDDDSYPDERAVKKAIAYFNENPLVSVIAAKVINNRTGYIETKDFNERPDFFVGCGAFIKREVFKKVGGFNEMIFIYLHELEFCARCYDENFNIKYVPEIIIYHEQSSNRVNWKNKNPYKSSYRFYHYFISYSVFLLQHFHYRYILVYLPKWIINRLLVAVRMSYYSEFFKANLYLFLHLRLIISKRKVLNKLTQKFYRYGNIPFFDRHFFKA